MPKASTLATSSPATVTALRDVLGVQDVLGTVNIYDDTTAGLAATVDGDYFSVPSADADEYLILYKNVSEVATEVKRYPSAARVTALEGDVAALESSNADMSALYRAMRSVLNGYRISDAGAVVWSPAALTIDGTPGFYYEVNDLSSLYQDTSGLIPATAAGQTVKLIRDLSGNGNHATNATGWVLGQDSRGYYYLTMDGASVFKTSISWSGTDLVLAAAVNQLTTPASNEFIIGLGTESNSTDWGGLRQNNTTGQPAFVASGALGTTNVIGASQGVPADPHVIMGRTPATAYRDRTAVTGTGSISDLSAAGVVTIGALTRQIGNTFIASGRFYGATGAARAVTDAQVASLNDYMSSLYGVSGMFLAVGDSHTFNDTLGVAETDFYTRELARLLGDGILGLNFGVSGNTTGNMVARLADITEAGTPEFAIIYGGTNDSGSVSTVQASPAPTTTTFKVGSSVGGKYDAGALLTVGGVDAEVLSVASDTITLTAPLASPPAVGAAVSLRTKDNLVKIGNAIKALGCDRLLIPGLHYYNFSSGLGDTTTTPNPNAATLRQQEQDAATELDAVYVDFYDWMRDLIVAGTYTQGDDLAWHVAAGNAHLNATGEQILADALYAALQAQGWA